MIAAAYMFQVSAEEYAVNSNTVLRAMQQFTILIMLRLETCKKQNNEGSQDILAF